MSAATREKIVDEARAWIGTPYRHQASLKGVGCDCLGLVRGVWRVVIGDEPEPTPPYTPLWAEAGGADMLTAMCGRHFVSMAVEDFRAGDLLVFRMRDDAPAKHVAIASGAAHMIHAHDGARVAEVAIGAWRRRIVRAFAFPELSAD